MRRVLVIVAALAIVVVGAYLFAPRASGPSASPTPSRVGLASSSPTPTVRSTPTPSPTPSPSPSPSPSPTPSPTPSPSPTPTPTPSPSPSPTPLTIVSPDGYTLTLPPGWIALPIAGGDITVLLSILGNSQPQVAQLIRSYLEISGAKVSLVGADPTLAASGLPPAAIVLLQPTLGFSLDFVGGVVAAALGRVPGIVGGVQREKLQITSGDAIRFTFEVQGAGEGQPNQRIVQYLVVRGSQGYLVTFTTSADQIGRDGPTFERIVGSLTFP